MPPTKQKVAKKRKRLSEEAQDSETIQKPTKDSLRERYTPLLEFCVHDLKVRDLLVYLEKYSVECDRPTWSRDELDQNMNVKCSRMKHAVLQACESLDSLDLVTSYLFDRFARRRQAFAATGTFTVPCSEKLLLKLQNWVDAAQYVGHLTKAMENRSKNADSVFKANVLFTRSEGFSSFTIARYDLSKTSLVEAAIIYAVDGIPSLFITPFQTSTTAICQALQKAFSIKFSAKKLTIHEVPLYEVIIAEAARLRIGRDHFSQDLQYVLRFQPRTLLPPESEPTLQKYPLTHSCPFNEVKIHLVEGFLLFVRKNKASETNMIDLLYEMEKAGVMIVSESAINELANGVRNVFTVDEFLHVHPSL